MYFHIAIKGNSQSRSAKNFTHQDTLEKVAIPFVLNLPFRLEGAEFKRESISEFKIEKTQDKISMSEVFERLDSSSVLAAFFSLAKEVAKEEEKSENVTDDILKEAEQSIKQRNLTPNPISSDQPKVRLNTKKAFIVMSFHESLKQNVSAIKEACGKYEIEAVRVDGEISSQPIIDRILTHLMESNYVIADLTHAKPNVYYELGYFDALCDARSINKAEHLILFAQNIADDAHFDVRHRGIEKYDNPFTLMQRLEQWFAQKGVPKKR